MKDAAAISNAAMPENRFTQSLRLFASALFRPRCKIPFAGSPCRNAKFDRTPRLTQQILAIPGNRAFALCRY